MKKRRKEADPSIAEAVVGQARAASTSARFYEPQQPPPYVEISAADGFPTRTVHVRSQADANQIIETLVRAMPHLKP